MIQIEDDSVSDYSPRQNSIYKQKASKRDQIRIKEIPYECQPLLEKHSSCNSDCLSFVKQNYQNEVIRGRKPKVESLPLLQCKAFIQNSIIERQHQKQIQIKRKLLKKSKLRITRQSCLNNLGIKTELLLECQGCQLNKSEQILPQFTQLNQENKFNYLKTKKIGLQNKLSINQIRFYSMLHSLERPFLIYFLHKCQVQNNFVRSFGNKKQDIFFFKPEKNEEIKQFISTLCGFMLQNYKLIFIDEYSLGNISKSSNKQWHIIGSFQQTMHRISSFKYLIGALGQNSFLYFQLFEGIGKAYIFQDFITSIVNKAQGFSKSTKFVLIMDNCSIHKSSQMQQIISTIPFIFTPAYRPEFNAIEHIFGWIKRKLVILFIISEISDKMTDEWCCSILKPLLSEINFIE